jgi:hypothetical protein
VDVASAAHRQSLIGMRNVAAMPVPSAVAVGEGAMAVQLFHARLAERQQVPRIAAT